MTFKSPFLVLKRINWYNMAFQLSWPPRKSFPFETSGSLRIPSSSSSSVAAGLASSSSSSPSLSNSTGGSAGGASVSSSSSSLSLFFFAGGTSASSSSFAPLFRPRGGARRVGALAVLAFFVAAY